MSRHFVQSGRLRAVLMSGYRAYASAQIWRSGPRIFVNSMPKAGTHLLTSELSRFPGLQNSRLHILTREVNKLSESSEHLLEFEPDISDFNRQVRSVRGSQYFSSHLPYDPRLALELEAQSLRTLFVTRDPRDVLVSQFHYVVGLKRHHLHQSIVGLTDDVARYEALAFGMSGPPPAQSLAKRMQAFQGWLNLPEVLVVRFEDLVGARGGGDDSVKATTLRAIAAHCGLSDEGIEERSTTASSPTATLRKGKANAWRGEIPHEIVARLHAESGDLIRAYGYSVD